MPTQSPPAVPVDPQAPWPPGLSVTPQGPDQNPDSYLKEYKNSREITKDLQRESIVERWVLRGSPDEATLDPQIQGYQVGKPHPWFPKLPGSGSALPNAYLTSIRFKHWSFGTGAVTSGQQGEAQSWTIMIVTFTQRPCPALYEERWTVSLQAVQEWYSLPMTPEEKEAGEEYPGLDGDGQTVSSLLSKSLVPVPILRPFPVYQRRYVKIKMTRNAIRALRQAVGKTNGRVFLDEDPGYWMFDGFDANLLHGNDDIHSPDTGWYELAMVFRGDPLRHHQYAAPLVTEDGLLPVDPTKNPERYPTYASLHKLTKQYSFSMIDWNNPPTADNAFDSCSREDTNIPNSAQP